MVFPVSQKLQPTQALLARSIDDLAEEPRADPLST
jgi:hypothetical protein